MSKPITVAQAMKNLSESFTPQPPAVKIHKEKLANGLEWLKFWLSTALTLQIRTLVVWGFLALFFPALGITWFMVMFGLWAIRHTVPINPQATVDIIAGQRK